MSTTHTASHNYEHEHARCGLCGEFEFPQQLFACGSSPWFSLPPLPACSYAVVFGARLADDQARVQQAHRKRACRAIMRMTSQSSSPGCTESRQRWRTLLISPPYKMIAPRESNAHIAPSQPHLINARPSGGHPAGTHGSQHNQTNHNKQHHTTQSQHTS